MTLPEIDALNQQVRATYDNDARQALAWSQDARRQAEQLGYARGLAVALQNSGDCHWILLDYFSALPDLIESLRLFRELRDVSGEAAVLNSLGKVHFRLNDYEAALDHFTGSLRLRRLIGDPRGEAGSLNNIGLVYFDMARYLDAYEYHAQSLKIHEEIGNLAGAAIALNNLGLIHEKLEDSQSALDCFQRSLEIKRRLGNLAGVCASLNNLGHLYRRQGDYSRALDYNRQGLELARQIGHRYDEAQAWINLGEAHQALGDLELAMTYYEEGLKLLNGAGDGFTRAETLIGVGENFAQRGLGEQAEGYLNQALTLSESLESDELISHAHHALATIYEAQQDPARALEHFKSYHQARARLFTEEFGHRRRVLQIQAEIERVRNEAEIYRLKNVELAQAYRDLHKANEHNEELLRALQQKTQELERLAREDTLTGVSNRRHLYERAALEYARACRYEHALTVVMVDVDDFKRINDRYSHQTGDVVLRTVAQILRGGSRAVDVVGRYGGEEFMLLLVETGLANSLPLCERLRAAVQNHAWREIESELAVTISVGVADSHEAADLEKIMALADRRLYHAKQQGKNRVCGADGTPAPTAGKVPAPQEIRRSRQGKQQN